MESPTRRRFLKTVGLASVGSLTGCLRFAGNAPTYTVTSFSLAAMNYEIDDLRNAEALRVDVESDSDSTEIPGSWEGEYDLIREQSCAGYRFDVLEGDSKVATTAGRILVLNYQFAVEQTRGSFFITAQPSVGSDWELSFRLKHPEHEYTLTPSVRPSDGVFEIDLTNSNIEPGRYQWNFTITPPNADPFKLRPVGDTIELVSVKTANSEEFPSRSDAITTAGKPSNTSATQVASSTQTQSEGLSIKGSVGTRGRILREDPVVAELSSNIEATLESPMEFGGNVGRRFRISNQTTGKQLVFDPE